MIDLVRNYFRMSTLLERSGQTLLADYLTLNGDSLVIPVEDVNSYVASVIADFIRQELLARKRSFSFETVMSSPDKVRLLDKAQSLGYRTYLYYVATEDPEINVSRVRNRVLNGGHDVPEDKIRSRYDRSLDLLLDAIKRTNRAYIWDNSGGQEDLLWIAEVTDGKDLEIQADEIPTWFKSSVLDKLQAPPSSWQR